MGTFQREVSMNRTMTILAIIGILAALYFLNKYGLY